MKTLTYLTLFFAWTFFAQAADGPNYGLHDLVPVERGQVSVDGDWIRCSDGLYRKMALPRYRGESILFVDDGSYIVGAQMSEDKEFVFYGRNNYQRFQADWKPSRSKPSSPAQQRERSPIALLAFVSGMIFFLWSFARYTKGGNCPIQPG